jgi:hypothetical protein
VKLDPDSDGYILALEEAALTRLIEGYREEIAEEQRLIGVHREKVKALRYILQVHCYALKSCRKAYDLAVERDGTGLAIR